ncbi:MAG: sigma factor, partial [Natronospirillum sp.]
MSSIQQDIEAIYRLESRRVLASLLRLLNGNFDLAEEALQDAFAAALTQWPKDGVPDKPRAWLISTGRFKAIDRIRKRVRHDASLNEIAADLEAEAFTPEDSQVIEDDQLRLIF